MAKKGERYRKLPGHRRGLLRGSSLWVGADHLLSVKSVRFREEYKRFHLGDVQAIVVAKAPRFHISTRSIGIGALWGLAYLFGAPKFPWLPAVLWTVSAGLVCAWVYVSWMSSCRCRIFTAVSADDLPSIYRTWTARQFLAEVGPLIWTVQGTLEGEWAEAVEARTIGPAPAVRTAQPAEAYAYHPAPAEAPTGSARTLVSDVFVGSLFADALLNILTLHSLTRAVQWVWYGLAVVQVGAAILIFLQHHRGVIRAGMQKLAIATLMVMGAIYYLRQIMAGVATSRSPMFSDPSLLITAPGYLLLREVDAGASIVLGLIGLTLIFMARQEPQA